MTSQPTSRTSWTRLATLAALILAALAASASSASAFVRATNGTITGAAGTTAGFAGDGGPADQSKMNAPSDVAFLSASSYLIADRDNDRIRQVLPNGNIVTVAGSSGSGLDGDGGPATAAELDRPHGVSALLGGAGYLIADTDNDRIRKVAADGIISTFAGTSEGLSGDGGPATSAQLDHPSDTAVLGDGSVIVADTGNNRIRRISPAGIITTIAGTTAGFGGDGGPATSAKLNQPSDVTNLSDGSILVADTGNDRVRRIAPNGIITTVAGTGAVGFSGDGDPAAAAKLNAPVAVASLPNNGFLVADTGNARVRRVTPLGAIFTVVGSTPGNAGNGGPAKSGLLDQPGSVSAAPGGGFLVADTGNATVRRVSALGAVPPAVVGHSIAVAPNSGKIAVQPLGMASARPLAQEDLVPTGSKVDATDGHIAITVATSANGHQKTADVYSGPFTVTQGKTGQPFTDFRVPQPTGCPTTTKRAVASAAVAHATPLASAAKKKKKKKKKRVWVSEKGGHWKTSTGSSSASAVGTKWLTETYCDSTRVAVERGIVSVRDKVRHKTVRLKAGQSYQTKPRR
jgi:hypothetical protein